MATLSPSLYVHPSLDSEAVLKSRDIEATILHDLHWSQNPFDGITDLQPVVEVPSQEIETGYNRFTPEQLRCANNCSGEWGSLWDDGARSGNYTRLRAYERNLGFEINSRWKVRSGANKKDIQAQRLKVFIKVMWFFHMKRRERFGLEPPKAFSADASDAVPPPNPANEPVTIVQPTPSPLSDVSSSHPGSRVLRALDDEMGRITGESVYPMAHQKILSVKERQERLDARRLKFPHPLESRIPAHLRHARGDPYPLPVLPTPRQSRYSSEERLQRLQEAMQRASQPHNGSILGSIPSRSTVSSSSSSQASTSRASTSRTSTSHTSTSSQAYTATTILNSLPTEPREWLERLGNRVSPTMASHLDILIACLKRALPNQALTGSCRFVAAELNTADIQREYANIDSLEAVAEKFRRVIAEELAVRRDQLRRRESDLVTNWEDEYQANLREDKALEVEVAELLHGRRPTPTPPPPQRERSPYFVSSFGGSGLRAPPTSRVGRAPSSRSESPPPMMSVAPSTTGSANNSRPSSPLPLVDGAFSYDPACQFSVELKRHRPHTPPSSPAPIPGSGPIIFDDDVPMKGISLDDDEPNVDVDKVIGSSFYRDLARDISIDPSIDSAMVRTLTALAEGTPEDLLNHCVDLILEEYSV
ncbi:hypothetical protein BDZ89DRAFT_1142299 [Hymenopellis radicata]|nr:hypothetical protein BDZ89DRAFT_1142299 [Hymenopellis radicata]